LIYIVDDESHSYGWLIHKLGRLGREVRPFSDATEAYLALIEAPRCADDIILVDLMLIAGLTLPNAPDFFDQDDWRAGLRLVQALLDADSDWFRGRLAMLTASQGVEIETLAAMGIPVIKKAWPPHEILAAILALPADGMDSGNIARP
jgi:hypothetical protein